MPETTRIRAARPEDANQLTDLALRSKASWGYDAAFMHACVPVLTITPERIDPRAARSGAGHELFFVLEDDGQVAGFVSLRDGELTNLFIEPSAQRRGYGRALFEHAVSVARELGWERMTILSDPFAEAFYAAMGARRVGLEPSDAGIPGRMLPRLQLDLSYTRETTSSRSLRSN